MQLIPFSIISLILLVITACSNEQNMPAADLAAPAKTQDSEQYPVQIREVLNYQSQMQYSVTVEECKLLWTLYTTEVDAGVVQDYSKCTTLTLQQQLPFLKKIMNEVVTFSFETPPIHLFAMGHLNKSYTMSLRLGVAVASSPLWDSKKGQLLASDPPVDLGEFIVNIANEQMIYPELRQLFNEANMHLRLASVSHTKIKPAAQLPYYDQLKPQGIQPEDQIPYDALVVFSTKVLDEKNNAPSQPKDL